MTNKTTLKRLKLDPYFSKTIETNLNVWSHDQNSYEIKFEFYDHQCDKPIDLTGADMRILLDHADSKPKIYTLEIESKVLGLAKFIMPEQIRGCEGKFTAHIYADYPNKTHDFGSFTFYTKLSRLDGDLGGCMDEIYVSEFEKALEDIKEFKAGIDTNVEKITKDIESLNKQISDNDIITKNTFEEKVEQIESNHKKLSEDVNSIETNYEVLSKNVEMKFGKIIHMTDYVSTDGITDSTKKLQKVIDDNVGKIIFWDNEGETYITNQLNIPSNTHIIFSPNTKINANSGYGTHERVFNLSKVKNVVFEGNFAEIKMNKSEYETGEHRHAMTIFGCENVKVNNLILRDSGGDGIIIGGSTDNEKLSRNIFIKGVICDNNRRQGMSVVGGVDGLYVENSVFKNTSGTLPGLGIDIEPNEKGIDNKNIFIDNCGFENNTGGMLGVYNNSYNIKLNNLYIISGSQSAAIKKTNFDTEGPDVEINGSEISVLGISDVNNLKIYNNKIDNMVIEGTSYRCYNHKVIGNVFKRVVLDNLTNSLFKKNSLSDTNESALKVSRCLDVGIEGNNFENCGNENNNPVSIVTTSKSRVIKNSFTRKNKNNKNCITLIGGSNKGTIFEDNDFTDGCLENEILTPSDETVIGANIMKNGERSYHISKYVFPANSLWLGRRMVADRTDLPFTLYECIQKAEGTFSWEQVYPKK